MSRKGGTDGVVSDRENVGFSFERVAASLAAFYSNVDARTRGGEADATVALAPRWSATGSLVHTRDENRTDDRSLAQMPPLELHTGLNYNGAHWSAGTLWRVVAERDRDALNQGNIVGRYLDCTGGFGVLSLNAGWRPSAGVRVTAGVDNLFDRLYAEHLSRGGAMVAGFEQTTRVNDARPHAVAQGRRLARLTVAKRRAGE